MPTLSLLYSSPPTAHSFLLPPYSALYWVHCWHQSRHKCRAKPLLTSTLLYKTRMWVITTIPPSYTTSYDYFWLHYTAPLTPNVDGLVRLSGVNGFVHWDQITLEHARGYLTSIELAYQNVPRIEEDGCNLSSSPDRVVVFTSPDYDLYNLSSYQLTNLKPNEEYCVSIRANTSAGGSNYTRGLRLSCEFDMTCSCVVMWLSFEDCCICFANSHVTVMWCTFVTVISCFSSQCPILLPSKWGSVSVMK